MEESDLFIYESLKSLNLYFFKSLFPIYLLDLKPSKKKDISTFDSDDLIEIILHFLERNKIDLKKIQTRDKSQKFRTATKIVDELNVIKLNRKLFIFPLPFSFLIH